jgi:Leucine-rich repeat (LRR) protein
VGRLPLLVELRLESNQLEYLPDTMGRLSLLKILTLSKNKLNSLPSSMVGLKSLESFDVSENSELNLDALPDKLYRLHEMYQLLHSKAKRQNVISRAMAIRPAIRQAIRDDMFQNS